MDGAEKIRDWQDTLSNKLPDGQITGLQRTLPSCPGRGAAHLALLRRAGTHNVPQKLLIVIARSEATKQSIRTKILDCFAALAMTEENLSPAPPPRAARPAAAARPPSPPDRSE